MQTLLKATAAALFLISGAAVAANAQSMGPAAGGPGPAGPSVAALPPADQGPRTNSHNFIPGPTSAVAPSPKYIGPAPGASDAKPTEPFTPPPGYTSDRSMLPYNGGTVRPN